MTNYIERLKNYWKSENLAFIATFSSYKGNVGFFNDFINPVSKIKLSYPTFDNVLVKNKGVSFYYANGGKLINNHFYKVELDFTNNPNGKNNPYSLGIKKVTPLNQDEIKNHLEGSSNEELLKNVFQLKSFIEKDASKEHIRLRFERLNNPEANKIIANLMREIGKGMYSSKQRMIFELLQNADDAPGKEKVEFHIDANGDYFFVMHDGAPFSKDDVDAITSAAESTKRKDKKKTGYKGIGFKSVFTDSSEVWLKSGSYQFAFIRNSKLFEDFETFYFSSSDYKDFPKLIERHRKKYQKDILSYNSLTDIPWQVIPIWQDSLPSEFNDSNFNFFDNPVQFALKVGTNNIYSEDGYLSAIENIVKRPQFLLFLRNTSKFRSPKNRVTITRNDNENIIQIIKSTVEYFGSEGIQKQQILKYIKQIYSNIQVNNNAFSELRIGIRKIVEKNDLNEDTYHFVDLDGKKIETIPPKLASAAETEISFGISLVDNKISPEKEYLDKIPKYSSLFTYLPMEDTRFQLPFLVNADFVPSSDRQKIQGDNLWNKYIMIKVAEKHIATLALYAQEYIKDNNLFGSYLSLLLRNPIPEDDTAQQIIDSYNEKYLEQLDCVPFVVNDHNQVQLLSESVVDNSGLTDLFGHDIFYEIIETEKRLPHFHLDASYLKDYDYLKVETIDLEDVAAHITPEICERLGEIIAEKSIYEEPELLQWLNKLVIHMPINFGKIPFIVHNKSLYSLETLVAESSAWLVNKNTTKYAALLTGLGYHTINLNLDKYSNIDNYLLSFKGYLNDKALAYERLATNSNLPTLSINLKLMLIDFLQNSEFMVGIGETKYFGELRLFVDENNVARPLRQLISREDILEVASIHDFRIAQGEFSELPVTLKKELITKAKLFTSFILSSELFAIWSLQFNSNSIAQYVGDLKSIFSWKNEDEEILQSKWADIPWLYVDDKIRFLSCDKVFWSNAFTKTTRENYLTIKEIFHTAELKILPLQNCGDLIQAFKLKTDDSSNVEWTKVNAIETLQVNTLLDWMENDGNVSDFFEQYSFVKDENGLWSIIEIGNIQIFDGSETELKTYINSNAALKLLFTELDKSLCGENRNKIGLLQGDKLLKAIIDTEAFDQNLASLLPSSVSPEQLKTFVTKLTDFNLKTGDDYNGNTPEHIILYQLLKLVEDINAIPEEVLKTLENLRGKIKINQNPLSDFDLSNRIQFGKGDDKKILNLSDVLIEFKGESDVLDGLIESFVSIKEKAKLRKLIFKTRPMPLNEVCTKIEAEKSTFYTVHQVVFQLLFKNLQGVQRQWSKKGFVEYWVQEENESQLHTSYKTFLDVIFDIGFTDISGFNFNNLVLKNCVDKNYAINSEKLPQWLEEWISLDQIKRSAFISNLGFNGTDSSIVKLRKAAVAESFDSVEVIGHYAIAKTNTQIIWNTILWLSSYRSQIISRNIEFIKQVNNYVRLSPTNLKAVVIPVISSVANDGSREYFLESVPVNSNLYLLSENEKLAHTIFTTIKKQNESALFIDSSIGNQSTHFKTIVVQLKDSVDISLLNENSRLWEEPFYKKWEYYTKYPIFIYNGNEIPYVSTFNEVTINKFTNDLKVFNNGKYYVSRILKNDVLNNLPSSFPANMLTHLKEWHYKTLQNEALLDEDSFEYKENIDRLLQDRLGISKEDQKRESGNAKTHAVYFLDENGFNISNVNNAGAYLSNIIDPDGNQVKCIVRSAKGGLLYLDKEHWDMLEESLMYLIVIYPGNSPRLFKDRLELLEEELAENILFRVPNNKLTDEINGVFNALESESHLILVTSEKMKESLFSKLKQKTVFNKEENAAVGNDDFTF